MLLGRRGAATCRGGLLDPPHGGGLLGELQHVGAPGSLCSSLAFLRRQSPLGIDGVFEPSLEASTRRPEHLVLAVAGPCGQSADPAPPSPLRLGVHEGSITATISWCAR